MSEFVYIDFTGTVRMVSCTDTIKIIDSATTIFLRIGQHINMIIRRMGSDIPESLKVLDHLITFRVEGIVAGLSRRIPPYMFAGNSHTRFHRRGPHRPDIKTGSILLERRVTEKLFSKHPASSCKFLLLILGIPFGNEYDIYPRRGITVIGHLEGLVAGSKLFHKIRIGIDVLFEFLFKNSFPVTGIDLDPYLIFRVRENHRLRHGFTHSLRFGSGLPLIEQGTIASGINLFTTGFIEDFKQLHPITGIIQQRHFRTCPIGFFLQFVEKILLVPAISAMVVVEP